MKIRVALAGNPNVGKTVIFNALTGSRQYVGNWPGVTVEKKVGKFTYKDAEVEVVDLPGSYSLSPYSIDEKIARDYILEERPDVVVNIVDASNLERNLYLTVQLLEIGANVVVALNMMDEAEARGMKVDAEKLSEILNIPVVPMVAVKGIGFDELKEVIYERAGMREERHKIVGYGKAEKYIESLEREIEKYPELKKHSRWLAIKLLEGEVDILRILSINEVNGMLEVAYADLIRKAEVLRKEFGEKLGEPETYFADKRYEFIKSVVEQVLTRKGVTWTFSDMLDRVLIHRGFGIPIFLSLMWAAFQFTFAVSAPFSDAIDTFFGWLGEVAGSSIENPALSSLLADGVIAGVGSVLVFLPPIFLLFLILSILEDSGYLARAAFVMDRVMHKAGLSGKSTIPMLLGFGCNVPAVMATRTIEDWKDRLLTILVNPLMSCSARLPIYVLFAGAFFAGMEGAVIFSMYLMGIVLAGIMAFIFRKTIFKGQPSPLILEMPPYRIPTLRSVLTKTWIRGKMFLRKAGTIIFAAVVVVWFLGTYPGGPGSDIETSYASMLGHALQPLFAPMGWDWKAAVALFFGFIAKEVVVGTYGTLYGLGEVGEESESLRAALHGTFTPLNAYAFMAFALIYIPCVATIGVIRQEAGWKWMAFAVAYELLLAYAVALAIVGIGHALWG
ncbi:ferrous iron transport protein B [Ferroglobus placidus DSM 10642]|uniref:Ferrous iron transport protein B n=1 Tax=Ferroglobus placidus (strain DSM 10642 / AEDII12DO) TaxID=589924 RepID=D3S2Y8_FERPA|nr:ferrous iron transport protein B [Ferroglobus placidus]ADC64621.1 ferrous iron transport protein B [Ferroglobus placidus DSM 10642]